MEPSSLAAIFSVEVETGVVVVDATGPHLLAEGALGHINVGILACILILDLSQ